MPTAIVVKGKSPKTPLNIHRGSTFSTGRFSEQLQHFIEKLPDVRIVVITNTNDLRRVSGEVMLVVKLTVIVVG